MTSTNCVLKSQKMNWCKLFMSWNIFVSHHCVTLGVYVLRHCYNIPSICLMKWPSGCPNAISWLTMLPNSILSCKRISIGQKPSPLNWAHVVLSYSIQSKIHHMWIIIEQSLSRKRVCTNIFAWSSCQFWLFSCPFCRGHSIRSSDNDSTGFWPPGSLHTLGAVGHI